MSNYTRVLQQYYNTKPDGAALTGGGILASTAYDYVKLGLVQENRDKIERALIEYALETQIPLLGICRGMQQINAYFGGRTSSFDNLREARAVRVEHPVTMKERTFNINNYHNDGVFINGLGHGLEPLIIDEANGVVEAFWTSGVLAVQWHPERPMTDISGRTITDKLIVRFLNGYPVTDIIQQ